VADDRNLTIGEPETIAVGVPGVPGVAVSVRYALAAINRVICAGDRLEAGYELYRELLVAPDHEALHPPRRAIRVEGDGGGAVEQH
jgi:hypothetical protein